MEISVTFQEDGLEGPEVWVQVRSDDINMSWAVANKAIEDPEQRKLIDECDFKKPVLWTPDPLDGGPENPFTFEDWFVLAYKGAGI